jgi:hypothetical protein
MILYPKTDSSRISKAPGEGGGIIADYDLLTAAGVKVATRQICIPSPHVVALREAITSDVGLAALALDGSDSVAATKAAVDAMSDAEWRALGV